MRSSFVDSIKLILSDRYEISDSDYKSLSDILIDKGLSEEAFESGLIQIINLMVKYHYRFPISLTFLNELWEYENISFNFVKMLGGLLKNGVISLRKVKKENFLKADNITKSNSEDYDRDLFVVVYGSPAFNDIYNTYESILTKKETDITESVKVGIPKKVIDIVTRSSKVLKNYGIKISLESYEVDEVMQTGRVNLNITQTSDYGLKDNELLRNAKKYIKAPYIKDIEIYKDGEDELFLGVEFNSAEKDFKLIADGIGKLIANLELSIEE